MTVWGVCAKVCVFSVAVCPSGPSHSFNHADESLSSALAKRTASSSSVTGTSPKATFTGVVELASKAEPTGSPDGSKSCRWDSARLLVLLAEVARGIRGEILPFTPVTPCVTSPSEVKSAVVAASV